MNVSTEVVAAWAALISAATALISTFITLRLTRKQIVASLVQQRMEQLRSDLAAYLGRVSHLLVEAKVIAASHEDYRPQVRELFLLKTTMSVTLDSRVGQEKRLNATLGDILHKLESAIGADVPETVIDEVVGLVNRATLEFHSVREGAIRRI